MSRMIRGVVSSFDDYDHWLLATVFILCLLGTVMVFGAASYRTEALGGQLGHYYYLVKHLVRLLLGLGAMMALAHLDYRYFRRRYFNWALFAAGMLFVLLPVVMEGIARGSCRRWLSLFGWFPVQPLEFVKIALVLFLAERLTHPDQATEGRPQRDQLKRLGRILLAPMALIAILVLQPNYGNALVIGMLTLLMLFLVGVALRWLILLIAPLALGAAVGIAMVPKLSYRVTHWWDGLLGDSPIYQVEQSLIGLGAGGLYGLGLGAGHQRFYFLPESHTDFIFAILGEELGFLGTATTIALFAIMAWRGLAISQRAADRFGRVTAGGLTALIFLYVMANVSMTCGLIPVMGVPLPLLSYGGSALVTNLAAVGILLSIDRRGRSYQIWRARWRRGEVA